MLAWIEMFLAVVACLGIGAMYAITGYEVTNLFTDGPNWKPWEQMLFWLIWPVIIPAFFAAVIAIFLAAALVSIFVAFVTCYDILQNVVKRLFKK